MTVQMLLLPLFAEVILTVALLLFLLYRRGGAISRGDAHLAAGEDPKWPRSAVLAGRAYASQFELPVLFYVLTLLVLATNAGGLAFVVLAWVFVALRLVHAIVLAGDGPARLRFASFALGAIVLGLLWVFFMIRILFAAAVG